MNNLIYILIIVVGLIITYVIYKKLISLRYQTAFFFGRCEHFMSRVAFGFIVLTILLIYLKNEYALYSGLTSGVCWIIYWISHRMEKLCHPKH